MFYFMQIVLNIEKLKIKIVLKNSFVIYLIAR